MGLKEGVHSHLSSCIYRVGVVGGGCRYQGGVVEKGSTAVGGQGNEQGWGGDGVEIGACVSRGFEIWLQPMELT